MNNYINVQEMCDKYHINVNKFIIDYVSYIKHKNMFLGFKMMDLPNLKEYKSLVGSPLGFFTLGVGNLDFFDILYKNNLKYTLNNKIYLKNEYNISLKEYNFIAQKGTQIYSDPGKMLDLEEIYDYLKEQALLLKSKIIYNVHNTEFECIKEVNKFNDYIHFKYKFKNECINWQLNLLTLLIHSILLDNLYGLGIKYI